MKHSMLHVGFAVLFFATAAYADSATVRFRGTVTSTGANTVAISEVQVGDEVAGEFSFNTNAPDAMPADPDSGLFAADRMSLSVRGFSYGAEGNSISITNDRVVIPGQPSVDAYEIVSPLRNVSGPSLSGLPPAQIDIVLVDTDAAVFSDDSLPLSLNLGDFEIVSEVPYGTTGGRLIFQSVTGGAIGEVRFRITSLSIELQSESADVILYPQLAVGGGYEVVLIVNNKSGSDWSGLMEPLLADGSLDYLSNKIDLKPRETRKFTLAGGSEVIATGLKIKPDPGFSVAALAVSYFFNYVRDGKLIDSTGVPMGRPAARFTFPVERTRSVDTGLAIRRIDGQADGRITLTLYDAMGTKVDEMNPGSDFARFFTELFANVPEDFVGSVVAESSDDFYLVVIRLETTDDGFQLTSVPAQSN